MFVYCKTTSKKTKKQKLKQKASWEAYKAKYDVREALFAPTKTRVAVPVLRPGALDFLDKKSISSDHYDTFASKKNKYTGDNMIGIAQMPKSNAVPVFNHNHVLEISRMRRSQGE
ncbi:MAG: hypothetical protein EBS98_10580 [Chitinophagia bacterium]|jgi:hypothetical protein|nr:hypothetical protein [Chitinophagia bacterium]